MREIAEGNPASARIEQAPEQTQALITTGAEAGPVTDKPPMVLCHGWPELAFSWRHQIKALSEAGIRVIAPDQRGYGATDRPESVEDYDIEHLTGDLVGLLDHLGIDKAVFVGHDWGGFVVWQMPLRHIDRVAGVIGVTVRSIEAPSAARQCSSTGASQPRPPVLRWLQMIDTVHGYALSGQDTGAYRLLSTSDGGRRWTDVTPGAGAIHPSGPITVVGRTTRLFSTTLRQGVFAVERSDDGGRSWRRSVPVRDARGQGLGQPFAVDALKRKVEAVIGPLA